MSGRGASQDSFRASYIQGQRFLYNGLCTTRFPCQHLFQQILQQFFRRLLVGFFRLSKLFRHARVTLRALIQRVSQASVAVDNQTVGSIGPGLVVFLGIGQGDSEADAAYLVEKIANLRIFADSEGRFNLSALDTAGEVLLISQFTLYAETRKGRRPSFTGAAPPEQARPMTEKVEDMLRERGLQVAAGVFQAMMKVSLVNEGPVTIFIDSADRKRPRAG